jgi:hypothetical protein
MSKSSIAFLSGLLLAGTAAFILSCGGDDVTPSTNNPPYEPYSPTPNNGSPNRSVDSDLYWRCEDPDGDILTYNVYFDTSETPAIVVEDYSDTMYALGTLDAHTTYYWKVVAYDPLRDSTAGPLWTFTTGDSANVPPNAPYDPVPADSATAQPLVVALSWVCTDPNSYDDLSYDVYLDTTVYMRKVAEDLSTASFTTDQLEPETQYYWRVIAFDNHGDSTAGPYWHFTTGTASEGVFAAMAIGRVIMPIEDTLFRMDQIVARFDSTYAPCSPIQPLEAALVTCGDYIVPWEDEYHWHRYFNMMDLEFIELGHDYVFQVTGNSSVPALNDTIEFPTDETYLTDPAAGDTASLDGFAVTWAGAGDGTVMFMVLSGTDTTDVSVETANDGSYTFTADDLEPLGNQAGEYGIILIHQNSININADGYDPRSFIWARVINITQVYLH